MVSKCIVKFKLKYIRLEHGWTQEYVSVMTGLSRQALVNLENNPKAVQVETLQKICAGLGLAPEKLFEVEEV